MSNLVKFNELDEKILDLYVKGYKKQDIAVKLEIPIDVVNKVFRKKDVKQKLQELIENREILLKAKHLEILNEITDEMVKEALENGSLKDLLGKGRDILDVISLTNSVAKEQEKKRLGTSEGNVLINILNQLSEGE